MHTATGDEAKVAIKYINEAAKVAQTATCLRRKCGSVIVKDGIIIGRGANSPVAEKESQRRCTNDKNAYHRKVTDKTCCMHAEQRAIIDALKHHPNELEGSTIYYTSIDENNQPAYAGQPYCTICSKMSLECGIKYFVLNHKTGPSLYPTDEYNTLSYEFQE